MSRIKTETINGAKWALIRKLTLQPLQFVFGMVLARLVTPDEMGILGLTGIFFAVANSLKEAGFGAALIRKQDRTEEDINTVFWFNIVSNFIFAVIFWFLAPWFAEFFNQPALLWITRVSVVMSFVCSSGSVHWTLYTARRDFKTPSIITLVTSIAVMPVTLYLAYIGWSYWAVLAQGLVSSFLNFIIIWIVSPWKPKWMFSWKSFCEFFGFGFKLSLSGIIYNVYYESRKFVIGKFYSPAQLAFYGRAEHLCLLPGSLLQAPLEGVMYPILATIQDDKERLDRVYRQYMRLCLCPNVWVMLTLTANAESLVHLLYGETWLPCVPYLRVLCCAFAYSTVIQVNFNYLMVKGRSDLMLQREVILRIFGFTAMLVGAYFSVMGICIAYVVSNILNVILTVTYTLRVSDMTAREQFADFYPYLLMAMAANIPGVLLEYFCLPYWFCAFGGPGISLLLYWAMLHKTHDIAYSMILETVMKSEPWRKMSTKFPLLQRLG